MRGSEIAKQIANHLFGENATRLVLARDRELGGYDDLGGWCKQAVVESIDVQLQNLFAAIEQVYKSQLKG